jgi:hypothetical protein
MVLETLRTSVETLRAIRHPIQELAQQRVFRVVPARTAAAAVQDPTAAAGGGSEITEHRHLARGARSTFQVQPDASPAARYDPRDPALRRPVSFPPDRALQVASRALRVLAEIADNDVHFDLALERVQTWLTERKAVTYGKI